MSPDKILTNLGILLFGCTAVWLIGRPEPWRRWGYILALFSQPFWLYGAYNGGDWGVFLISCVYAYSWAQGVWFHWVKTERLEPEPATVSNSRGLSGA